MGGRKLITNITNCHYLPQIHTNTVCKIKCFTIRPAFTFNNWLGLRWDLISSKKKLLNASQVSSLQSNEHFQLKSKSYVSVSTYHCYLPNGVSLYPRQWQPGTYIHTQYLGQVIQFQIVFQGQIYHYARHDVAPEWF